MIPSEMKPICPTCRREATGLTGLGLCLSCSNAHYSHTRYQEILRARGLHYEPTFKFSSWPPTDGGADPSNGKSLPLRWRPPRAWTFKQPGL